MDSQENRALPNRLLCRQRFGGTHFASALAAGWSDPALRELKAMRPCESASSLVQTIAFCIELTSLGPLYLFCTCTTAFCRFSPIEPIELSKSFEKSTIVADRLPPPPPSLALARSVSAALLAGGLRPATSPNRLDSRRLQILVFRSFNRTPFAFRWPPIVFDRVAVPVLYLASVDALKCDSSSDRFDRTRNGLRHRKVGGDSRCAEGCLCRRGKGSSPSEQPYRGRGSRVRA